MQIQSVMFQDNEFIPMQYTCEGENINPPLLFLEVPQEAVSLVLIVDDPDAISGLWTHWVVFNIPPDTHEIGEGSTPPGIEGTTSYAKPGYGGPCPPNEPVHHYRFKLYALDTMLDLDESATREQIETAMSTHVIDEAELIGLYQKTR